MSSNQYLFFTISTSTNKRYRPTTSTEVTKTNTLTLLYVTQTDFSTRIYKTIQDILANFVDKHSKQDTRIKETISDQYAKFYARFEKQL